MYRIVQPVGGGGTLVKQLVFLDDSIPFNKNKLDYILEVYYNPERCWGNMHWSDGLKEHGNSMFEFEQSISDFCEQIETLYWFSGFDQYTNEIDPVPPSRTVFLTHTDFSVPADYHTIMTSAIMTPFVKIAIKNYQSFIDEVSQIPNTKILFCDILYGSETLDREWYNALIKHFNLQDRYEEASIIHAEWLALNNRVHKEYYDFCTSEEFSNRLKDLKRN